MAQHPVNRNTNSSTKGIAIADGTAFDPCSAVNCATAGPLTVTWLDGSTSSYHFVAGDNHIQITMVGTGGAAAGLIALYNN
jgi:hypothetical protein